MSLRRAAGPGARPFPVIPHRDGPRRRQARRIGPFGGQVALYLGADARRWATGHVASGRKYAEMLVEPVADVQVGMAQDKVRLGVSHCQAGVVLPPGRLTEFPRSGAPCCIGSRYAGFLLPEPLRSRPEQAADWLPTACPGRSRARFQPCGSRNRKPRRKILREIPSRPARPALKPANLPVAMVTSIERARTVVERALAVGGHAAAIVAGKALRARGMVRQGD